MQTIFITGASSGIGKETSKLFSAKGWRVIATMRNLRKGEDLAGLPNVLPMPLAVILAKEKLFWFDSSAHGIYRARRAFPAENSNLL